MRKIPIVIDTREQTPLSFDAFPDVRTERRTLWPGDYSLKAASRTIAIERKSVSDLIGTMTGGYAGLTATTPKRFDCELLGLCGILFLGGRAFILVEPDHPNETAEAQIRAAHYRAMIPPHIVLAFVDTLRHGWRIPVVLANTRDHASEIVATAIRAADAARKSWRPFDRWLKEALKPFAKPTKGGNMDQTPADATPTIAETSQTEADPW